MKKDYIRLHKITSFLLALIVTCSSLGVNIPVYAVDSTSEELQNSDWDYSFTANIGANSVSYLDEVFDVYQYTRPTAADATTAIVGPVEPSAVDPNSHEGKYSYFTTQMYGSNSRGGLKPTSIQGGNGKGFTSLTYAVGSMKNFEAEYEFYGNSGQFFGLVFGAKKNAFPITFDYDNTNDTGVMLYMEPSGKLQACGAMDTTTATVTGGATIGKNSDATWYPNIIGASNIYGSITGDDKIEMESYISENSATHTVCVKVENGVMTVYEKNHSDMVVTVSLTDKYQGGYVSLVSNNWEHGAFKSFRVKNTGWDCEMTSIVGGDSVDYLDEEFDVYQYTRPTAADATTAIVGPVEPSAVDPNSHEGKYSYFTTQMYGSNSRGGLKPTSIQGGNGKGFTSLTYALKSMRNFEAEYEFYGNSGQFFGLVFGAEKNVFPITFDYNNSDDTGVMLYMEPSGKLQACGAMDTATATVTGGAIIGKNSDDTWYPNIRGAANIFGSITGDDKIEMESYISENSATHTVCVKVENGVMTVYEKNHSNMAVTVSLTDKYQGGYVSLVSNNWEHGAFKSFRVRQLADAKIYGMSVNDKENPIGIDDATPAFSWKLKSDTMGQKQTAYRILVSKEPNMKSPVWDSGKVKGSDTTDVVCGVELDECTRYYWQVTSWDVNGIATQSDVAYFETAFITTKPLNGASWIEVGGGLYPTSTAESTKLYSVEADVSCSAVAASLCFNVKDTKNLLMWQIVRTDTAVKIRPHKLADNKFTAYTDIDITDTVSPTQLAEGVNFRVEVSTNTIDSYVNNTLVNSFDVSQLGVELFLGRFATRVATDEVFTLSNLKAISYLETSKGEVLFDYSCDNFNPFFRGKLNNGKVEMNTANGTGILFVHAGTATFRKQFDTQKTVEKARLYITSYGSFNAYLNGERVGNKNTSGERVYDELAPGWTDEAERICYYTYDITDQLLNGTNTLAVGVQYGWSGIELYYSNEPSTPHKLMAYMKVEYTDGTSDVIVTDDSWKSSYTGPVMIGDIFQGEYYDATANVSYRMNDYDDSLWGTAKEVTYDTNIVAIDGGQIHVREDLERVPQSVKVYSGISNAIDNTQYGKINISATYGDEQFILKKGETAVVDFGQNFAGWESLTFSGQAGTEVLIRHAEMLNDNMGLISRGNDGPEGSLYTANLRNALARTIYKMNGEVATYRPTSTYYGFRYLEITATDDITIEKIRGQVATSVVDNTGTFETSDELINQIYSNSLWGQYSNYFGQATDCPQRDERLGYSGDAQVFVGTAVYNSNVKSFLRNFLLTLEEGQADDGAYANTMPGKASTGSSWAGVAGWADAGIIVPYTYYKQYGDATVLEDMYASMTKYMDYLKNCGAERKGQQFGDWLSYATNNKQMINYISYVYTIWDTQMMQEIASVLGKTDDVQKYKEMEQTYLGYFQNKFLDENGDLIMNQQTAYLFALKLGLYKDEEAWNRGKELLIASIEENGNCLNTGFLGTSIIMETLVEIGESDLAYKLLFQDSDPSWLFSVKQGATTMWERWNSYSLASGFGSVEMNSFNHYAYGCIAEFMYATMLGIKPVDAGYEAIVIEPKTTDELEYVSGSYDSVNGLIESRWDKGENGLYCYNFTIPMNTTGVIKLEEQNYGIYYVNGVRFDQLSDDCGATYVGNEDGLEVFEVVSGEFTFTSEAIPKLQAEKQEINEMFEFKVEGLSEYSSGKYTASGQVWYTFPESEEDIVDTLNNKFHFYYDREGTYYERTIFENGDTGDTYGGSQKYETRWILLYNHFLQRQGSKTSGEIFRKIDSMVPLTSTGKEVYVKNFETTYDIRFESEDYGAVILGFRQQTPGKFTNGYYKLAQNQAFVAIGRKGITIAGGTDIYAKQNDAGDMYNSFQTEVYENALPQEITVKVRVVGTTCEVTIYDRTNQNQLYSYTETIPYELAGAISYGVSTVGHDVGNIKLTALNDQGEICDIATPYNDKQDILMYRNGKIQVLRGRIADGAFKYTLSVLPDKGFFMRTGSLVVQSSTGELCYPEGDSVVSNGGVVSAQFYRIGDVTYDSSVDIVDLVRLKKVCEGKTTETAKPDADCNGDNTIDNQDCDALRKILVK